jgi:hypothetical protein
MVFKEMKFKKMISKSTGKTAVYQQKGNELTKDVDDTNKFGLTDKQMILVDTLVTQNVTIKSASQIAGYSKGESGRVSASRALRTPKVQRYLIFRVASELGISSVQAVHRLKSLMNSKSDYVSLEATKDVLDRVGLRAPDKIKHSIDGDIKIDINLD